jgi:hypothetical protein
LFGAILENACKQLDANEQASAEKTAEEQKVSPSYSIRSRLTKDVHRNRPSSRRAALTSATSPSTHLASEGRGSQDSASASAPAVPQTPPDFSADESDAPDPTITVNITPRSAKRQRACEQRERDDTEASSRDDGEHTTLASIHQLLLDNAERQKQQDAKFNEFSKEVVDTMKAGLASHERTQNVFAEIMRKKF